MSTTPTRPTEPARRGGAARRAGVDRAATPPRPMVGRDDLRLARHAEDQARARAADRRDDHAGAVLAHVHVPLRRRPVGLDRRVPAVHPARHPRAVGAVYVRVLRRCAEHRHDQGRRRPLPLAADLAPGAARRRSARRQHALRARGDRGRGARPRHGLQPRGRRRRGARRDAARDRLRVRAVMGVHDARSASAHAERGDEHRLHVALPLAVSRATSSSSRTRCPVAWRPSSTSTRCPTS